MNKVEGINFDTHMSLELTSYIYEWVSVHARLQIHIEYYITTTKEQKLDKFYLWICFSRGENVGNRFQLTILFETKSKR
jgi:hypothetical protein